MSSEFSDTLLTSAFLSRLIPTPFFTPFPNPDHNSHDPHQESTNRVVIINPLAQSMVVIENSSMPTIDSLFDEFLKSGEPPASQASIDRMPRWEIKSEDEIEEIGGNCNCECVICLDGFKIGDFVSEMACKHRFHGGCVEKWLRIHGTCPVCRFKMPVDDSEKRSGDGIERGRRRRGVWVRVEFGNGGLGSESGNLNEDSSMELGD